MHKWEQTPRILIIDDEPHLLRALSKLLSSANYAVLEAETGDEGLHLAQEHHPDIILLDVVLPDLDGIEVCRRIKAEPELSRSAVILLSGIKITSEQQAGGLEAGADGYIVRPISNRELLARVEAMMRIKQAENALMECREHLDERVKRRTAELRELNRQLESDVTVRKHAEEALQRAHREWVDIFEAIGHPTVILDAEPFEWNRNRDAEALFGWCCQTGCA